MKRDEAWILVMVFLVVGLVYSVLPGISKFAGSHSMYRIKNSSIVGDLAFCEKCHTNEAGNLTSGSVYKAHGAFTACICHGFYPNYTNLGGENITINLKHNLTKNIYCTNCHSSYDLATGNITIGNGRSGLNQSGHYIYLNRSNSTEVFNLYNKSKWYLETNFYS